MELDIMGIIQQYAVVPVAAVCFMLGYMLKRVFATFPDNFVPLALLPVGIVGVLWVNGWAVTPENIIAGICSAALAVYLHQNYKQLTDTTTAAADPDTKGGGLNE